MEDKIKGISFEQFCSLLAEFPKLEDALNRANLIEGAAIMELLMEVADTQNRLSAIKHNLITVLSTSDWKLVKEETNLRLLKQLSFLDHLHLAKRELRDLREMAEDLGKSIKVFNDIESLIWEIENKFVLGGTEWG